MGLPGRHAVVTGAARGIGAAIARTLAAEGARLTLMGRHHDALQALARGLDHAQAADLGEGVGALAERHDRDGAVVADLQRLVRRQGDGIAPLVQHRPAAGGDQLAVGGQRQVAGAGVGLAAVRRLHRQPAVRMQRHVQRIAGDPLRADAVVEALVHVHGRHARGVAAAAHRVGLGVGQDLLEAHRVGVGQVVRQGALRLQRGAGAGHGDVEGLVHRRCLGSGGGAAAARDCVSGC